MKALRTLYLIAGILLAPLASGEYTSPATEAQVSKAHKMDTQAMEQLGDIYAECEGVDKELEAGRASSPDLLAQRTSVLPTC